MLEGSRPFASPNKVFGPGKRFNEQLTVHQIGELVGGLIIQFYEGLTVRPVYSTSCGSSSVKCSLGEPDRHSQALQVLIKPCLKALVCRRPLLSASKCVLLIRTALAVD